LLAKDNERDTVLPHT